MFCGRNKRVKKYYECIVFRNDNTGQRDVSVGRVASEICLVLGNASQYQNCELLCEGGVVIVKSFLFGITLDIYRMLARIFSHFLLYPYFTPIILHHSSPPLRTPPPDITEKYPWVTLRAHMHKRKLRANMYHGKALLWVTVNKVFNILARKINFKLLVILLNQNKSF